MQAGKLRHRLMIQSLPDTPTRGTSGEEKVDDSEWQNVAMIWGSVEPLAGREFFAAQQVNADVSHRIRLRYLPGITPKMRLKFGDRIFDIVNSLNIEERNRELELLAREVV